MGVIAVAGARVEDAYRLHHVRLWRALLSYTRDAAIASDSESEAFTALDVVLSEDRTTLTATANGRSVEYRPLLADDPRPVCA